ncbi:MAG TPA: hypothetical protein VFT72_12610 [Opitutaceae bacterium]|nr:hypothetical protein [Opitutaceae bacterium]
MKRKHDNRVLWWAALGFLFLFSGWTAIFTLSARFRIADVPVQKTPAATPNR